MSSESKNCPSGTLVWAQLSSNSLYWPAIVIDLENLPESYKIENNINIYESFQKKIPLYFLSHNEFYFLKAEDLIDFEAGMKIMKKQFFKDDYSMKRFIKSYKFAKSLTAETNSATRIKLSLKNVLSLSEPLSHASSSSYSIESKEPNAGLDNDLSNSHSFNREESEHGTQHEEENSEVNQEKKHLGEEILLDYKNERLPSVDLTFSISNPLPSLSPMVANSVFLTSSSEESYVKVSKDSSLLTEDCTLSLDSPISSFNSKDVMDHEMIKENEMVNQIEIEKKIEIKKDLEIVKEIKEDEIELKFSKPEIKDISSVFPVCSPPSITKSPEIKPKVILQSSPFDPSPSIFSNSSVSSFESTNTLTLLNLPMIESKTSEKKPRTSSFDTTSLFVNTSPEVKTDLFENFFEGKNEEVLLIPPATLPVQFQASGLSDIYDFEAKKNYNEDFNPSEESHSYETSLQNQFSEQYSISYLPQSQFQHQEQTQPVDQLPLQTFAQPQIESFQEQSQPPVQLETHLQEPKVLTEVFLPSMHIKNKPKQKTVGSFTRTPPLPFKQLNKQAQKPIIQEKQVIKSSLSKYMKPHSSFINFGFGGSTVYYKVNSGNNLYNQNSLEKPKVSILKLSTIKNYLNLKPENSIYSSELSLLETYITSHSPLNQDLQQFIQELKLNISASLPDSYFVQFKSISKEKLIYSENLLRKLLLFHYKNEGVLFTETTHIGNNSPEAYVINILLDDTTGNINDLSENMDVNNINIPDQLNNSYIKRLETEHLASSSIVSQNNLSFHREKFLAQIESYLTVGRRDKATELAISNGDWVLAFLCAPKEGVNSYQNLILQYCKSNLTSNSALPILFLQYSGQFKKAFALSEENKPQPSNNQFINISTISRRTEMKESKSDYNNWNTTLSALISNRDYDESNNLTKNYKCVLNSYGSKLLLEADNIFACHFAYICAGNIPSNPSKMKSYFDFTLIGCHNSYIGRISVFDVITIGSLRLTEFFEISLDHIIKELLEKEAGQKGLLKKDNSSNVFKWLKSKLSQESMNDQLNYFNDCLVNVISGSNNIKVSDILLKKIEKLINLKALLCPLRLRYAIFLNDLGYHDLSIEYLNITKHSVSLIKACKERIPQNSTKVLLSKLNSQFLKALDDFSNRIECKFNDKTEPSIPVISNQKSNWDLTKTIKSLIDNDNESISETVHIHKDEYKEVHSTFKRSSIQSNSNLNQNVFLSRHPPQQQHNTFTSVQVSTSIPIQTPSIVSTQSKPEDQLLNKNLFSSEQTFDSKPPPHPIKPKETALYINTSNPNSYENLQEISEKPPLSTPPKNITQKSTNNSPISSTTSSPVSLKSDSSVESSSGLFGGIRKKILKILYPDAHDVSDNIGSQLNAYYCNDLNRWVFPGEEEDAKAKKSLTAPPSIQEMAHLSNPNSQMSSPTSEGINTLTSLMAPPMRSKNMSNPISLSEDTLSMMMAPPQSQISYSSPSSNKSSSNNSKVNVNVWTPTSSQASSPMNTSTNKPNSIFFNVDSTKIEK